MLNFPFSPLSNILTLSATTIENITSRPKNYTSMEYCGGGDLGSVIKDLKRTGEFAKEEFVWRILSQLVTALYRCHYGIDAPEPGSDLHRQKDPRTALKGKSQSVMILHRDLKPENSGFCA